MPISVIGDYRHHFIDSLGEELKRSGAIERKAFDLEPLRTLNGMLNNKDFTSRKHENLGKIRGIIQMVKVYPFMRAVKFGIKSQDGKIYDMGRPIFNFEKFDGPVFDLETFKGSIINKFHPRVDTSDSGETITS